MSQTFKFKVLSAGLLIVLNVILSSCQKSDKNDLKETQLCLNTATSATALTCLEKITSNNTAQAFKLRCAAMFISQGYTTPSSFTSALNSINGSGCGGGCSSTVAALNGLNFHSGDPKTVPSDRTANETAANLAFSYCSQSETNIYMQIASMFKIGTLATNMAYATTGAAGATPTEAELLAAVAALPAADLGAIVNTTYAATCTNTTNASDEIKKYCGELSTSIAATNGTDAAVGACLQHIMANPGATTCP